VRRINGLLLIAFVTGGLVMLEIACKPGVRDQARPRPRTQTPPATQLITERPLETKPQPTLIKQGRAPLVYMTESAATLRFGDHSSGNSELARARVTPRQIVRIDAQRGVIVGEAIVRPGPLPGDHMYGIWLEPDASGFSRDTIVNPQPNQTSR
jgi:hypothetical protein